MLYIYVSRFHLWSLLTLTRHKILIYELIFRWADQLSNSGDEEALTVRSLIIHTYRRKTRYDRWNHVLSLFNYIIY